MLQEWSLNPFEVREVLQAKLLMVFATLVCLNPFEVREVLQAGKSAVMVPSISSQSL